MPQVFSLWLSMTASFQLALTNIILKQVGNLLHCYHKLPLRSNLR